MGRVPPRGLVADERAQEHHVLAQRLQLIVDHRLRHVAVCTPPESALDQPAGVGFNNSILREGDGLPGHQVREEEGSRSARKSSSFSLPPSSPAKSLSKWPSKSATVASTFSTVISAATGESRLEAWRGRWGLLGSPRKEDGRPFITVLYGMACPEYLFLRILLCLCLTDGWDPPLAPRAVYANRNLVRRPAQQQPINISRRDPSWPTSFP